MALEISKNSITRSVVVSDPTARQNIDTQINLPDYCSDVKRILRCYVNPGISSVSLKGEKVNASGGILIRLIYVNDDDKLDSYETQLDLDAGCEMSSVPDSAVVRAKCKTDYVNCRAMSQRRVYVSSGVTVSFSVITENKKECICGCDGMGVQLRKTTFKTRNIICQGEKSFDLSETVALQNDMPDVGRILCENAYVTVESQKTVTGKMLIKGELVCDVVYCADKEDNKVQRLSHTMPVSQIVDLQGVDEKSCCSLSFQMCRLMVNAKADSSGKNRLLEIGAKISAFVKCSEVKEFTGAFDCYSTECELAAENETVDFILPVYEIREKKAVRKDYELQKGIREICSVNCEEAETKLVFENGSAKILFTSLLTILYIDEKGVPAYGEKSFEFEHETGFAPRNGVYSGEVSGLVKDVSFSVTGKNSFEVTADVLLEGEICRQSEERFIKTLSPDENSPKKVGRSAIIIYYPQKGEMLWDIAKMYNTTTELIKSENELGEGEVCDGKMLIIPAV